MEREITLNNQEQHIAKILTGLCSGRITYKEIESIKNIIRYRLNAKFFTRNRKMNFAKTVYYTLNKKGLTSKMEITEFNEFIF